MDRKCEVCVGEFKYTMGMLRIKLGPNRLSPPFLRAHPADLQSREKVLPVWTHPSGSVSFVGNAAPLEMKPGYDTEFAILEYWTTSQMETKEQQHHVNDGQAITTGREL